eukprot:407999-Rhodomonas_salina.1
MVQFLGSSRHGHPICSSHDPAVNVSSSVSGTRRLAISARVREQDTHTGPRNLVKRASTRVRDSHCT